MENKDNEVFVLHLEADGTSYWTGPGFDNKPKRKTKKTETKEEVTEVVETSEDQLQ